jgi:uncharacterized membrane-anchored protein
MNNYALFGMVLSPNLDGYIPFLPAMAILFSIGIVAMCTMLKPGAFKSASAFIASPIDLKVTAVMAAQVVLLAGFVWKSETVVHNGTEIVLKCHSFDPFDLFRGNYLRFQFDISHMSSGKVKFVSAKPFATDDVVFVVLEKSEPQWVPVAVYDTMPKVAANQVALKGKVENAYDTNVNIHYGLEQFFYPDGKNIRINQSSTAKIKVDRNGDAVLTELIP